MTTRKRYTLADLFGTVRRLLSPVEDAVRGELTPRRVPVVVVAEPVPDYTEMDWHTYAEPLTAACFGPAPVDPPEHESWDNDVDEDGDTVPEPTPLFAPADDEPVPEEDSAVNRLMLEREPLPTTGRVLYRKVGKGYKEVSNDAAKRLPDGTQLYTRSTGTGYTARYAKECVVRHGYVGCGVGR